MVGKILKIGNTEYTLRITFNSLIEMNRKYPDLIENLTAGKMDFDAIRIMLYYQLKNKSNNLPKLKLDDVGDLIDTYIEKGGSFIELSEIIAEAQMDCLGMNEEKTKQASAGTTVGGK